MIGAGPDADAQYRKSFDGVVTVEIDVARDGQREAALQPALHAAPRDDDGNARHGRREDLPQPVQGIRPGQNGNLLDRAPINARPTRMHAMLRFKPLPIDQHALNMRFGVLAEKFDLPPIVVVKKEIGLLRAADSQLQFRHVRRKRGHGIQRLTGRHIELCGPAPALRRRGRTPRLARAPALSRVA